MDRIPFPPKELNLVSKHPLHRAAVGVVRRAPVILQGVPATSDNGLLVQKFVEALPVEHQKVCNHFLKTPGALDWANAQPVEAPPSFASDLAWDLKDAIEAWKPGAWTDKLADDLTTGLREQAAKLLGLA